METFLPLIEAAFTPDLEKYGFKATRLVPRSSAVPADVALYENGDRKVTVCYGRTTEQWCEVSIAGYGDPEPLRDLLSFVNGVDGKDERYLTASDPHMFGREAKRCCKLLVAYCGDYLRGDIDAFRRTYRELLLVATIRGARSEALAQHHWEDVQRYHGWIKDYWSKHDLQEAEQARDLRRRFG